VAIFVINQKYDDLKHLMELVVIRDHFTDNFRHEFWHLLHDRYEKFNISLKEKVAKIIESLEVKDQQGKANERATAFTHSLWLSAIKDFGVSELASYTRSIQITNRHPEHPDFPAYTEVRWVEPESPMPLEDLLGLSIDDLVEKLNSLKVADRFDELGRGGLARAFKEAVKVKALEYHQYMKKFADLDLEYVQPLIDGFRELWVERKELPWHVVWSHLFDFCNDLISRKLLWPGGAVDEANRAETNRTEVVRSIARLIEDGTRSDENAFDADLLPAAKSILSALLSREKGAEFKEDDDAVFISINSTRGRCLNALINHSLRSCRVADKEDRNHASVWKEYESIYNSELQRGQIGEYEFTTLVTSCLQNFLYMSPEWVYANLATIFDQSNYRKWLCAMQGYAYVSAVTPEVYDHLSAGGHYLSALDDENLRDRIDEKVVRDIVLAYLNNHEQLENRGSLIATLFNRRKYSELGQIVWFVWTLRGSKGLDLPTKVRELWPKMMEAVDSRTNEGRQLASSLCRWAEVIETVDDATEGWLIAVAAFAEEGHSSDSLLQGLSALSEKQPLPAQRIWLRMLVSCSYDYPEGAIRQILENLVKLGPEGIREAKEIVDAYLRHGLARPAGWLSEIIKSNEEHET
jgi:hypothetical protein